LQSEFLGHDVERTTCNLCRSWRIVATISTHANRTCRGLQEIIHHDKPSLSAAAKESDLAPMHVRLAETTARRMTFAEGLESAFELIDGAHTERFVWRIANLAIACSTLQELRGVSGQRQWREQAPALLLSALWPQPRSASEQAEE